MKQSWTFVSGALRQKHSSCVKCPLNRSMWCFAVLIPVVWAAIQKKSWLVVLHLFCWWIKIPVHNCRTDPVRETCNKLIKFKMCVGSGKVFPSAFLPSLQEVGILQICRVTVARPGCKHYRSISSKATSQKDLNRSGNERWFCFRY